MRIPGRLAASALATLALTLATAASAAAHLRHHDLRFGWTQRAVFVQSDNPAGNTVTAYARAVDGQLSPAGTYSTGGLGGALAGSVVDHLSSQNSLTFDAENQLLLAVNAGSNTVSVFSVDGDRLRLRQTLDSGGVFPASIAVHGNVVYVLNALNGGDVSGYFVAGAHLVPIPGSVRQLGLDPNATPQFVNTPGDIAFSPDGRSLLVTTKLNTSSIDVFGVEPSGRLSEAPIVNSEPGTVPFSLAFQSDHQVAVAEAGPNAVATFELAGNGALTQISSLDTAQAGTCWLVADGPALFAGNAASGSESSLIDAFGGLSLIGDTSTDAGTVDGVVTPDGRFLYVQTGAAGIVDEFKVGLGGSLTEVGSVTVPGAAGGEGITTS